MARACRMHVSSLFSDAISVRPTYGLVARAIVIIIAALLVGRAPAVLALAAPGLARGPLSAVVGAIPVGRALSVALALDRKVEVSAT